MALTMRMGGLLLLLSTAAAVDIIESNGDDFAELRAKHKNILAKFHVPWCMHCHKANAPFEAACEALEGEFTCVNINADPEHSDVAERYRMKNYPSLKAFTDDHEPGFYWPKEVIADEVKAWATGLLGPALITVNTKEELAALAEGHKVLAVGFFEAGAAEAEAFEEKAKADRDHFRCAKVENAALAAAEGVKAPGLAVYKQFDAPKVVMEEAFTADAAVTFIRAHSFPLFQEITPYQYQSYLDRKLPLAWLFVNPDDAEAASAAKTVAAAVARDPAFAGKVSFVWTSGPKFTRMASQLALSGETWPAFAIDVGQKTHYAYNEEAEFTEESIKAFVSDFLAGELKPTIRSQPAYESRTVNGLTTVVGDTFQRFVFGKKEEDAFIQFYAPWCGHCLSMKRDMTELARHFQPDKSVRVIEFDATRNDWPVGLFPVEGYPTLYFVKAGKGDAEKTVMKYDGETDFQTIKTFIEDEATTDKYRVARAEAAKAAEEAAEAGNDAEEAVAEDGEEPEL